MYGYSPGEFRVDAALERRAARDWNDARRAVDQMKAEIDQERADVAPSAVAAEIAADPVVNPA